MLPTQARGTDGYLDVVGSGSRRLKNVHGTLLSARSGERIAAVCATRTLTEAENTLLFMEP